MRWNSGVQDLLTPMFCALCSLLVGACAIENVMPPILDLELHDPADPVDTPEGDDFTNDSNDDAADGADPDPDGSAADSTDATAGETLADDTHPANDYCAGAEPWDDNATRFEQSVLERVNQRRSEGAVCGDTEYSPTGPLVENGALRCAARIHAQDMALRDFFSHTNPDGDGPGARIDNAEYDSRTWGENIAFGYASPESVVEGWMNSPGHCSNIMNPSFTESGIGYEDGDQWVQVFAAPR